MKTLTNELDAIITQKLNEARSIVEGYIEALAQDGQDEELEGLNDEPQALETDGQHKRANQGVNVNARL